MKRIGKSQAVTVDIEFTCPFCGLRVSASIEAAAVFHELPICKKFLDLEPIDFLHECNVRRSLN